MGGRYVPSLLAAIGDVIERHLVATGFMPPRDRLTQPETAESVAVAAGERRGRTCPRCGSPSSSGRRLRRLHRLRLSRCG